MWSNEYSFKFFQTNNNAYIWRKQAKAYGVDCLLPTVILGGREGSVLLWVAMSQRGLDLLVILNELDAAQAYHRIWVDHLHPMVQTLFIHKLPVLCQEIMLLFDTARISATGIMNMIRNYNTTYRSLNHPISI